MAEKWERVRNLRRLKDDAAPEVPIIPTQNIASTGYLEQIDIYDTGFSAQYRSQTYNWTWTKNELGQIISLTTADNVVIPVNWHEGGPV